MNYLASTICAVAALLCSGQAMAQKELNTIFRCAKGDISYSEPVKQKESTAKTIGTILGKALELSAGQASSSTNHPEYADAVRTAITGAIGEARRIRVTDGKFLPNELAEGEQALYFDGSISAISTTYRIRTWEDDKKVKHEDTEYKGVITGVINIKDARTDAIVKTINIKSSSYSDYWLATAEKALGYAIDNMSSNITNTLNLAFPLYASIVESATAKKDKQKEVYIDLGTPDGVYTGLHFDVYTVTTIAGKEARKKIGRLRIIELMGDEISLCKVTSGGKNIKEAIESGATLRIQSTD